MGSSLYTWDEGTVKSMDIKERIGSKEGEDSSICWQGHGISFLGCTWYNYYWLSSRRKNIQWRVLCEVITELKWWNQETTAAFGEKESVVLSRFSQIQPPWFIFLLQTWKNSSVVNDLPTMKRWSLLLVAISRSLVVPTINRISKLSNIAGKSVVS